MARTMKHRDDRDFFHVSKAGKGKIEEHCMECGTILRSSEEIDYGVCEDCLATDIDQAEQMY